MAENKPKKKLVKDSEMSVETFISMKGGISTLDRLTLMRKYKDEKKIGGDWMSVLEKATLIKNDKGFLEREM